ncbi:helix-turn-helix domain-containing protein [Hymenobacter sediminicola]|uniref:Helix-turn-helix transcriptional regulator n=1 Tax=Hymenobacter sediminicola TaxID=2761579 RepID=A0A7G7W2W9_9BACT|nr:helix-turn-helix transcriptional regulator [Hymenobacter sediminicola]QNH60712.1 helix-turn-helix transcriptional regulator [Hymenobacter sediminicola]
MPRPGLKPPEGPPAPGVEGVGRRIALIRQRFDLSMERTADMVEASAQAISDLENGKSRYPKADLLARFSLKLGVRLDWLILGQEPMLHRDENITRRQQIAAEASHSAEQVQAALDKLQPILLELQGCVGFVPAHVLEEKPTA